MLKKNVPNKFPQSRTCFCTWSIIRYSKDFLHNSREFIWGLGIVNKENSSLDVINILCLQYWTFNEQQWKKKKKNLYSFSNISFYTLKYWTSPQFRGIWYSKKNAKYNFETVRKTNTLSVKWLRCMSNEMFLFLGVIFMPLSYVNFYQIIVLI